MIHMNHSNKKKNSIDRHDYKHRDHPHILNNPDTRTTLPAVNSGQRGTTEPTKTCPTGITAQTGFDTTDTPKPLDQPLPTLKLKGTHYTSAINPANCSRPQKTVSDPTKAHPCYTKAIP